MTRELVVTDDMAGEAVRLFREVCPRTLVLAGGETPRATYQRLAQEKYPWEGVDVFFGDERCVPPDHPDSNYRMANETLLSLVPARVHRMWGESCDAESYERELRDIFGGLPRFDFVFLGLGADGHTASLFPGDRALDENERWAVRVRRPGHERLTLTLPVLSAASHAVFLVAGAEKRDALRRMMAGEDVPANRVAAERVVVLADAAAAAEVSAG
jgi:6-phosphogluconolactonase